MNGRKKWMKIFSNHGMEATKLNFILEWRFNFVGGKNIFNFSLHFIAVSIFWEDCEGNKPARTAQLCWFLRHFIVVVKFLMETHRKWLRATTFRNIPEILKVSKNSKDKLNTMLIPRCKKKNLNKSLIKKHIL